MLKPLPHPHKLGRDAVAPGDAPDRLFEGQPARLTDRMLAALRAALAKPSAMRVIIFCSLLLSSPSMWLSLTADDQLHELVLRGDDQLGFPREPYDLFAFSKGDAAANHVVIERGVFPWWSDPEVRIAFFRPLSSLSRYVDHLLWPNSSMMMHVHSMLWFAGVLIVLGMLYRALFTSAWVAHFALLLYALDDNRAPTVGWVANRNTFICLLPGVAALLLHHRARSVGNRRAAWLAPLALGVGLLGGETAVAVCAYLFAYACFLDKGTLKQRALSLAPYAAVLVAWRIGYVMSGYGATGSGLYIDPAREPLAFLGALAVRLPVLLLAQFGLPWSDFWEPYAVLSPFLQPLVFGLALVVLAILARLAWPLWKRDAHVRFWTVGALLSAALAAPPVPNDRLLGAAAIGCSALLASLLAALIEHTHPLRARWVSWAFGALMVMHLIIGPLSYPVRAQGLEIFEKVISRADESIPSTPDIVNKTLIMVNTPTDPLAVYFPVYRAFKELPLPKHFRWLATGASDVEVRREDARTLIIRPKSGFLSHSGERMFRSTRLSSVVGETVTLKNTSYEVIEVTEDARPAAVRVRFDQDLESPDYVWLQWGVHEYVPFTPPKVNGQVTLPAADMWQVLQP